MATCDVSAVGRRRTFWANQACTTERDCGFDCGADYGIKYYCPENQACTEHKPGSQRGIETDNWLRGLVINILFTDGKLVDTLCGWKPGARGGHWSDSYRNGRYPGSVGSSIRNLKTHGTISDAIAEINAYMRFDLQKLVTYGVALSIEVASKYIGNNTVQSDIIIYGVDGTTTQVGVSGQRLKNSWAWTT